MRHRLPVASCIDFTDVIFEKEGHTLRRIVVSGLVEDGDTSVRYSFDRGDRAFVLPHNERSGHVLLVQQLRVPVLFRGGTPGTTLEAPGGVVDGSAPEEAALREAVEEAGVGLRDVRHVGSMYMAPQMSGDLTHLFIGRYDASSFVGAGGGVPGELERVDVIELSVNEAFAAVESGRITDAKTALLLLHLKSAVRA